ncbi:MAG: phosphate ABC transporter ATP-binding protein [Candidatus Omnitrophica bacterium 4484_171]|nr:MAG: phosphate ABC transporter ATP-binding protein [Candidatus Omnitrophica bacterium 4484_171]
MVNKIISKKEVKISIRNLNIWYQDMQVIKNVNLDIEKNKVTAIIGPSGCGKSTLIKSINRMLDIIPEAKVRGTILLDSQNIYEIDETLLRKRIGMVFQMPNPFPKSIFENVAYGLKLHRVFKNREEVYFKVEKALKQAALWDEIKDNLDKFALDLSGGQQQRLCVARCIALEPEVILFDEPCSALDPIATAKIEELIEKLKQNYTIVIVTHNMQQAARISDYTAFLYLGELVEFGPTQKMFTTPQNKMTEHYLTGKFG